MVELNFDICDFIQVNQIVSDKDNWPILSPFDLRFKSHKLNAEQKTAISGAGVYLISRGEEVVYLGKYQPQDGNIIADRWGRHLQTITARGFNIGFGNGDPNKRRISLLDAVDHPNLCDVLNAAFNDQAKRFRDTGVSTTPNRLRFASENWDFFSCATPEKMQNAVTFRFIRIRSAQSQAEAKREVSDIEKRVLLQFKPCCNNEYKHSIHDGTRVNNTVPSILNAIRKAAKEITGQDAMHCVALEGRS
jgi:hypothetical protein